MLLAPMALSIDTPGPIDDPGPLDAGAFCQRFADELGPLDGAILTLDSRLVEDLGFDSLQFLLTVDFIEGLVGDAPSGNEHEIIEALTTVRSAYTYYLTHASMPRDLNKRRAFGALTGRLVRLRSVNPSDYPRLHQAAVSNEVAWRWRYGGAVPSYEEFLRSFSNGVLTQLVVTSATADLAIGLVVAYNASLANRTVYLAGMIAADSVGAGRGGEATMLFIRHLFRTWDFEKIYFEVPEFNLDQFASGVDTLLITEARLKSHLYSAGRRWDQLILAMYRSEFERRWTLTLEP
jgi:RimJ/RimL family protein N-acetyltransferase/acyl carrier protein